MRLDAQDSDDTTLTFSVIGYPAAEILNILRVGDKSALVLLALPLDREVRQTLYSLTGCRYLSKQHCTLPLVLVTARSLLLLYLARVLGKILQFRHCFRFRHNFKVRVELYSLLGTLESLLRLIHY